MKIIKSQKCLAKTLHLEVTPHLELPTMHRNLRSEVLGQRQHSRLQEDSVEEASLVKTQPTLQLVEVRE